MKLSATNFKSIRSIDGYRFSPVNLLAGVNSSGKTSLTQVLLLVKQTIENHTKEPFLLEGEYFTAPRFTDIFYSKAASKEGITLSFAFGKEDIENLNDYRTYASRLEQVVYSLTVKPDGEKLAIITVKLEIIDADNSNPLSIEFIRKSSGVNKGLYEIRMGQDVRSHNLIGYGQSVDFNISSNDRFSLDFTNLFPLYGEKWEDNRTMQTFSFLAIKNIYATFLAYFSKMYYIGPIRVKPEPIISYTHDDFPHVGIDGKFTRFILHKYFDRIEEETKRWMCDEFKLVNSLEVKKDGNRSYRILVNYHDVKVDICHIGLGVSQVLPIIVQGLLLPPGSLFVVDSPEVHLHPSVQSAVMDFFIWLATEKKVYVLLETHSDHCVTRIRRRIAEKKLEAKDVNLRYVTNDGEGSEYELQSLTDNGLFKSNLPEGFLDTQDKDFEEIIKQQLKNNG